MNEVRSVIKRNTKAINERNLDDYLKTLIFPFTYQNFNGMAFTVEEPQQYGDLFAPPWEIVLGIEPKWLRTDIEGMQEIAVMPTSAAFKLTLRWITSKETSFKPITAIWIAVYKNGAWGLQFIHNMGTTEI